jgi:hypothetical protein
MTIDLIARLYPLLISSLALLSSSASAQTQFPAAKSLCPVDDTKFNSWFESGTNSLNGVVKPADGLTFPDSPNCSFYEWSQQMFLWATSPAPATYGGGGGRIFESQAFFDVTPEDPVTHQRNLVPHTPGFLHFLPVRTAPLGPHHLPVIIDKRGNLMEVLEPPKGRTGRPVIFDRTGRQIEIDKVRLVKGKAVLVAPTGKAVQLPRMSEAPVPVTRLVPGGVPSINTTRFANLDPKRTVTKLVINGKPIFIDLFGNVIEPEQGQADGSVLLTQGGSLVYYSISVNDVFAYFATGVWEHHNGLPGINATHFPTTAADLSAIQAFAAAHGKPSFPDANALAVEIKAAWVDASTLPSTNGYITMQGSVPAYDKSNPALWHYTGQQTKTLALVAMHVVGSTKGHPEMIWASFEHVNNAPNAAYSYQTSSSTANNAQEGAGPWVFAPSVPSAVAVNVAHQTLSGKDIAAASGGVIQADNILRVAPWGSGSAAPNPVVSAAGSNAEVISINNDVRGRLDSNDVRRNYFLMGASWTIGGAAPTGTFNGSIQAGKVVGTSQMANTAMETFFQVAGQQCFSCHGAPASSMTDVSHTFSSLNPLFKN